MKLSRAVFVAAVLAAAPAAQAQIPIQIPEGLPGNITNTIQAALRVRIAPPALRQEAQPRSPRPTTSG